MAGFNAIPQVISLIQNATDKMIVDACKAIRQTAQQMAPVDTGFLQSSIYTETKDGTTYGEGMMDPPGDSYALDDIGPPPPHTGYVAVAASYGLYQEFGTHRMGAQPYLIPALEAERASFQGGGALTKALGGFHP